MPVTECIFPKYGYIEYEWTPELPRTSSGEREYALDGYTGIYGGPDMGGSNLRIGTKLCDWRWGFIKIDLHRYLPNWFNNTRFVYI